MSALLLLCDLLSKSPEVPRPESVGSSSPIHNLARQTERRQGRGHGGLKSMTIDDGDWSFVDGTVESTGDAGPWNLRTTGEATSTPQIVIPLSDEEIAEDIYAVTGQLPRKRPRKRPQAVQMQLNKLFPGFNLSGNRIKAEKYDVPDYG